MKSSTVRWLEETAGNTMVTIDYTKKDGSKGRENGRVSRSMKSKEGGQAPTTAHIPKYLLMYNCTKKAPRNVNTETITRVAMRGRVYRFSKADRFSTASPSKEASQGW